MKEIKTIKKTEKKKVYTAQELKMMQLDEEEREVAERNARIQKQRAELKKSMQDTLDKKQKVKETPKEKKTPTGSC